MYLGKRVGGWLLLTLLGGATGTGVARAGKGVGCSRQGDEERHHQRRSVRLFLIQLKTWT